MIDGSPRFLQPIDNLKVLSGQAQFTYPDLEAWSKLPTFTGSANGCIVSSGYMTTVCNKCKKFAPLGGPQIDGIIVCESCFEEHQVIDNTLPCPFKDPKRRKYNVKAKSNGPEWSYTTVTTQANT